MKMSEQAAMASFKLLHWQMFAEPQNTQSGYVVHQNKIWKSYLPEEVRGGTVQPASSVWQWWFNRCYHQIKIQVYI
jgi:hypothetical protein